MAAGRAPPRPGSRLATRVLDHDPLGVSLDDLLDVRDHDLERDAERAEDLSAARRGRREDQPVSSGNQSAISRSADSSESEPCTRLKVTSRARSPRIEPGAASSGSVAPIDLARRVDGLVALEHRGDERPPGDELDQLAEEGLLGVLGVVATGEVLVDVELAQGDDPQALALEARQDLTGEPALERVGLDQDQGSGALGHDGGRLSSAGRAQEAGAGRGRSSPTALRAGEGGADGDRPGARLALAWRLGLSRARRAPARDAEARAWLGLAPSALAGGGPSCAAARFARAVRFGGASGARARRRPRRSPRAPGAALGGGPALRRLAVGADRPAGVDRLLAGLARVLDPGAAARTAQVGALDRIAAARTRLLLELA